MSSLLYPCSSSEDARMSLSSIDQVADKPSTEKEKPKQKEKEKTKEKAKPAKEKESKAAAPKPRISELAKPAAAVLAATGKSSKPVSKPVVETSDDESIEVRLAFKLIRKS